MYLDANTLPEGTTLSNFDICIAGGGVAGLVVASELIGSNARVLVLSNGQATDAGPAPDPARQSIYDGTIGPFMTKVRPEFLTVSRLNMYGGTSNHFWFNAYPLDQADLEPRPGYRDASWPIGIDELNSYYPRANRYGDYGPFNYRDIAFWSTALHGQPFRQMDGDNFSNVVFRGQKKTNISQFQTQLGGALQAAGNVTVLFNAHALQAAANDSRSHVTSVSCASIQDGKPGIHFTVDSCRAYLLAQGGIEPVRLLRLSGGLGDNAQGHLGSGFMLHPVIRTTATVDMSPPVDPTVRAFYRGSEVVIGDDGQVVTGRVLDPLELGANHDFVAWGMLGPTAEAMAQNQIGSFHVLLSFDDAGEQITLAYNWESVPNPASTITLDQSQVDPVFGQPVVKVDWNVLETEKRTLRVGLELMEGFFKARGGSNFQVLTKTGGGPEDWTFSPDFSDPAGLRPGDHHMGALRMSASAEDGIVDTDCRVHTVDNLFVAGSGVFPTSGSANPTLTIVALAVRLADHLKTVIQ